MLLAALVTATMTQEPNVSLDWLMVWIALGIGLFTQSGLLIGLWMLLNMLLISGIDTSSGWAYWQTMTTWAVYSWMSQLAVMLLAGYLRLSLSIILCIAASCLFHQVLSWQINTYTWENVTLIAYRSEFMLSLSIIMLTTALANLLGGGENGGKRVRNTFIRLHGSMGGVLRLAAQKVVK